MQFKPTRKAAGKGQVGDQSQADKITSEILIATEKILKRRKRYNTAKYRTIVHFENRQLIAIILYSR